MPFDVDTAIPITRNKDGNPEVSNPFDMITARPLMPDEIVNQPKSVALEDAYKNVQDRRKSLDQMVAESESYDKAVMKYLGEEPPTPISVMHDAMNIFAKEAKGPLTLLKAIPPVAEWNFIAGLARSMTPEKIQDPQALLLGALKNVGVGDPDVVEPLITALDIKNPNAAALLSLLPSAIQFETLTNGLGSKVLFGKPTEELNPASLTVRENIAKDLLEKTQLARQKGLQTAGDFFKVNTPEKVAEDIRNLFEQGKLKLLDYPDVDTATKDLTRRIFQHWQTSLYQARVAGVAPKIQSAAKLLGMREGYMYIPDTKAIEIARQIIAGEPAEFPPETLESILKASGSPITGAVVKIGEKTYVDSTHEKALNQAGLSKDTAIEDKDYQALFRTDKGDITREEAKAKYGVERSTDLHQQAAQYVMDVSSKVKKPIEHKTFTGVIKARGGIDFSKDYNVQEMKEFGLSNTPGAPTPDEWAQTLMNEGLLRVPENYNPGDYLMEFLKTKSGRKMEELFSEEYYNRQEKEYLRNVVQDEGLKFDVAKLEKQSVADAEREINALLKAAGRPSVIPKSKIKGIIREETGQVSVGDLVSEEEALKGKMKAAERASKVGYRVGKAEGVGEEKAHTAEVKLRAKARKDAAAHVRGLVKDIQKLNVESLPLEYQDLVNDIKDQYDFKARTKKTLAERESRKVFVERQREAGETINIPDELLDLLDRKSLNNMTLDELEAVHDTIMRLYKIGKLKDKLLTVQKERSFKEIVAEAVDTITKGKGLSEDSTIVKALREQDKGLAKMSLEKLQYFMKVNLRPEVMFNQMDDWDVRGICSKVGWDSMEDSDESHSLAKDETTIKLEKIFEGLSPKEIYAKHDVGRFKGITKSNMFKIYAHSFNPDGMNYLEGSGITETDIKAISDFLSDKEKKMIADTFDFMDNYMWSRLSEIYEDIEGAHLGKVKNYFPIMRTEGVQFEKELEKEILESRYGRRASVEKGFTKGRTGVTKRGFKEFEFFKDLSSHIDKVEHYIAFARAVRDVRKFLYAPEIKAAITQKYGEDYYKMLDKWLKDVAYGKLSRTDEFWSNVLQASRRQFAPAVLSFNLLTTAKQVLGFFPGMEYAGKVSTLKFTGKYLTNPVKWTKYVKDNSIMMRYRNMRQEREFEELQSKWGSLEKLGHLTGWNKVQQMGLYLTLAVDRIISTLVWGGAELEQLSRGVSKEEAIREANRVTRRTQPMGGLIHLPDLFRGSEAQRQITFLRGHTNKFLNLQYEMVAKKAGGASSNGKFINQLLFFSMIPAVGFFWIEKKRLPKNIKEWIGAVGRQATISLWLVENLFQYLVSGTFATDTPVESYAKDLGKVFAAKGAKKIEKAAEFVGELAGAPVVGVRRLMKGQPFGSSGERKSSSKSKDIDALFKESYGRDVGKMFK